MTGLPTRARIGPHTWHITRDPTGGLTGEQNCNGVTVRERLAIVLADDLDPSYAREVLLHELLHACISSTMDFGTDDEERIVRAMAPNLLDALRRNPRIVDYLTA